MIRAMLLNVLRMTLFVYANLSLLGCHTSSLIVDVSVADDIAKPLYLKIYQLTNTERFNTAALLNLWHDDQGQLGRTLVGTHTNMLYPRHASHSTIKLNYRTAVICAVGFFQQTSTSHWRDCIRINFNQHLLHHYPLKFVVQASGIYFFMPPYKIGQKTVDNIRE